jgi:hypothetical protein
MKKSPWIFLSTLPLLVCLNAFSQNSFDSSLNDAVAVYTKAAGEKTHLYNGSAYVDYDHRIQGNPFFASTYFETASLTYDGIYYPGISMFYDILNDDVVIKNYNTETPLILVKEKISAFSFLGHNFIRLVADSTETGIPAGIYDLLYDGATTVIAKRKKIITEKNVTQTIETSFRETDHYYIKKENRYYEVHSKGSVLDIMRKNKSQIVKYMHKNKIRFNEDKEPAMIKMAAFNDRLNNPG